jgi:hypothetical protein
MSTDRTPSSLFGRFILSLLFVPLALFLVFSSRPAEAAGLEIVYGNKGIQTLKYNGVTVVNGDGLQIWKIKFYDAKAMSSSNPQGVTTGWGETNNGVTMDFANNILTYNFSWGTVKNKYTQTGDTLKIETTVSNNANSPVTVAGLNIILFQINFPTLPANFQNSHFPQLAYNVNGPGVISADFGSGQVVMAQENPTIPLTSGFNSTGTNKYLAVLASTALDGQAVFAPQNDDPVAPGELRTYTNSFRFVPSGTPVANVAGDVYQNFRNAYPFQINWSDHRAIGALFLSSSAPGDPRVKAGFPTNPRRYFNDAGINIYTTAGLQTFQSGILSYAQNSVNIIKDVGGQGMITWDIEGQEYPHANSYICQPDMLDRVAPEMNSIVNVPGSVYNGMKLADAYFKTFKDAGLKIGVCIRPQQFTLHADGTADQVYVDKSAVADLLTRKIRYAKDRWNIDMVYIDTAVDINGGTYEAASFKKVLDAFPGMLLMPEQETVKHYAYTMPWSQFNAGERVRTEDSVRAVYPQAYSAIYVPDSNVDAFYSQLVQGVKNGDILFFRGWFNDSFFNNKVKQIYRDAGVYVPPPTPTLIPTPTPTPSPVPIPTPVPNVTCAAPATNAFTGCYYDNKDFTTAKVSRIEPAINFDWGTGSPDSSMSSETFSARWEGNFNFDQGDHTFILTADDGVRLYIDNQLVINQWKDQPPTTYTVVRNMSAGNHLIKVEYYENFVGAVAKLWWVKNATPTPTPTAAPSPVPTPTPVPNVTCAAPATGSFTGCYYDNKDFTNLKVSRTDPSVNFDWGTGSPDSMVNSETFSAKWEGNLNFDQGDYTFTVTADDGIRLYVDNQLLIDQWKDQPPTTYTAVKAMTSGNHLIKVEYYENSIGAVAKLSWVKNATPAPTSTPTPSPTPTLTPPPAPAPTPDSQVSCATPSTNAFTGCYYNYRDMSKAPALKKVDSQINFDWVYDSPSTSIVADNFMVHWIGNFTFEEGNYTFNMATDDGSKLFVDGVLILNTYGEHPANPYTVSKNMTAGVHTITLEYTEFSGRASANLNWVKGEVQGAVTGRLTQNLSRGLGYESTEVMILQQFLYDRGYLREVRTGYFGNLTEAAVKQFQTDNGIETTGTVGPLTRKAINEQMGI